MRYLIAALLLCLPSTAQANVLVEGDAEHLTIHIEGTARIDDVLTALNVPHQLMPGSYPPISGTYAGTLREVLRRVLQKHDYHITVTRDSVSVKVFGASKSEPYRQIVPVAPFGFPARR